MAAWIPLTFAVSLVVGSIGTFVSETGALLILSGIMFGGAFAAMAVSAYRRETSRVGDPLSNGPSAGSGEYAISARRR